MYVIKYQAYLLVLSIYYQVLGIVNSMEGQVFTLDSSIICIIIHVLQFQFYFPHIVVLVLSLLLCIIYVLQFQYYLRATCRIQHTIDGHHAQRGTFQFFMSYVFNYLRPLNCVNLYIILKLYLNLYMSPLWSCIMQHELKTCYICMKNFLCVAFGLHFYFIYVFVTPVNKLCVIIISCVA